MRLTPARTIGGQRARTASDHHAQVSAMNATDQSVPSRGTGTSMRLTGDDLYSIDREGVRIDLGNRIDGLLRCVEALQPR